MLNRNTKQTFILAASLAASALILSGCRSMPGAGMFGMRSEPSVEALAGSGPTVTYPAPPSATAKPEAIASVAGGTASPSPKITSTPTAPTTTQVAGFDVSPGYATQATNMAAAQANGIHSGGSPNQPANFDAPAAAAAATSSYAFGSKAITPKSDSVASSSTTSYPLPGSTGIASPSSPLTTPSTTSSFTPPPMASTASTTMPPTATPPTATSPTANQGFSLPTDSPSFSAITPPAVPTSNSVRPTSESTTVASILPPEAASSPEAGPAAAEAPSFSTASAATGYTAPSTTPSVLPASLDADSLTPSGYMPGSTGASSGYPTTGGTTPTTNGSYYR